MDSLLIASYTDFSILAHKPSGIQSNYHLSTNNKDFIIKKCFNPAFILKHPILNFFYICYESIYEGKIGTFTFNDNKLVNINIVNSGGNSSCYLTFNHDYTKIININYWNSTISVHPLYNGVIQPPSYIYHSHQQNIANTLQDHLDNRQSEPHFHSATFYQDLLLVPDLGMDRINIFEFKDNDEEEQLKLVNSKQLDKNSGPRYIRILNNLIYVINELNSSIQVFILDNGVLIQKQIISTIPPYYTGYNTASNILIHPSNKFIYVSNRGHNSIAIFEIKDKLQHVEIISSHGKTPRHFNFNNNGSKLYVANQDSNTIAVFNVNCQTGKIKFKKYIECNSPNFVLPF